MHHVPVPEQGRWLGQVMRGYLAHLHELRHTPRVRGAKLWVQSEV